MKDNIPTIIVIVLIILLITLPIHDNNLGSKPRISIFSYIKISRILKKQGITPTKIDPNDYTLEDEITLAGIKNKMDLNTINDDDFIGLRYEAVKSLGKMESSLFHLNDIDVYYAITANGLLTYPPANYDGTKRMDGFRFERMWKHS